MQFRPTQGSGKIGETNFARKPGQHTAALYFQFSAFLHFWQMGLTEVRFPDPLWTVSWGTWLGWQWPVSWPAGGQGRQSAALLLLVDRTGREGGWTWGYENSPGGRQGAATRPGGGGPRATKPGEEVNLGATKLWGGKQDPGLASRGENSMKWSGKKCTLAAVHPLEIIRTAVIRQKFSCVRQFLVVWKAHCGESEQKETCDLLVWEKESE